MMLAVQYDHYSQDPEALSLSSVALPLPTAGQVLVRVHCAAINHADVILFHGLLRSSNWKVHFPFTPGYEFAGIVTEIGENVTEFSVGEEVFGVNWEAGRHDSKDPQSREPVASCFAEYLAISAQKLTRKPAGLSFAQAASIGLVGTAAQQCVYDIGYVNAESRVLVLGGGTLVGQLAVQLAKLRGAFVVSTLRSSASAPAPYDSAYVPIGVPPPPASPRALDPQSALGTSPIGPGSFSSRSRQTSARRVSLSCVPAPDYKADDKHSAEEQEGEEERAPVIRSVSRSASKCEGPLSRQSSRKWSTDDESDLVSEERAPVRASFAESEEKDAEPVLLVSMSRQSSKAVHEMESDLRRAQREALSHIHSLSQIEIETAESEEDTRTAEKRGLRRFYSFSLPKDATIDTEPDLVIDHSTAALRNTPQCRGFDFILDCVGEYHTLTLLKETENMVHVGAAYVNLVNPAVGLVAQAHPPFAYARFYCFRQDSAQQEHIARLVEEEKVVVPVSEVFPFTREGVVAMFRTAAARKHKGKLVLDIAGDAMDSHKHK